MNPSAPTSTAEYDKLRAMCIAANEQNFDLFEAQLSKLAP